MAKKLTTIDSVIEALGGVAETAELARCSHQAVCNWRTRGLPRNTFVLLTKALEERGYEAPPSLWRMVA